MVLLVIGKKNPLVQDLERDYFLRIRCPVCGWQPSKHDRWVCNPGCGHVWNTFDTRGRCPDCVKQWRETSCHRCNAWSPHDDWYQPPE